MRLLTYSALLLSFLLTSCIEDECTETVQYQSYEPVLVSDTEWRSSAFTYEPATEVCEPSGFYVYGDYLFIIDRNAGLHIFDNRDNDAPRPLSFLPIPGGQGIAVRNDILYISQYLDLLSFDLTDPKEPQYLHRTENVFELYSVFAGQMASTGEYVVEYVATDEVMELSCNDVRAGGGVFWRGNMMFADANFATLQTTGNTVGSGPEVVGQGGSLARFTINNGTLYAVDQQSLRTFSLADPTEPTFIGTTALGWDIETIFPYKDQLYIGSTTGMHIYDVTDPLRPQHLSTFEHVQNCDPVVVQDDIAYVTMWGGNDCGSQADQLIVLDVSDPRQPIELETTPMEQSHGLGVKDDRLYLCSGSLGLQVFALREDGRLGDLLITAPGFNAKDIIVRPDRAELIVFGWDQAGIRQYDYSETEVVAVSDLSVCPAQQ